MVKEKVKFENSVMIDGSECVTIKMICDKFGISKQTLRNRETKGILHSVKLPNRHKLYYVQSVQNAYEMGLFEKYIQL